MLDDDDDDDDDGGGGDEQRHHWDWAGEKTQSTHTLSRWEDVISKKTMTMTRSGRKGRTDVSVCTCPPSFPRGRSKCGCVAVYVCFRLFPVRCLIKFSWPPLMVDFIFKNKNKNKRTL